MTLDHAQSHFTTLDTPEAIHGGNEGTDITGGATGTCSQGRLFAWSGNRRQIAWRQLGTLLIGLERDHLQESRVVHRLMCVLSPCMHAGKSCIVEYHKV